MEELILTTPVTPPTRSKYALVSLTLNLPLQIVEVAVAGSDDHHITATYYGPDAVAMMQALNTANLTSNSLVKRILSKLVADGHLPPGTVTGTPL